MLIDDNELDNFIHKKIIESEKFAGNVLIHSSAQTALDYLKKNSQNSELVPDVIFLDIIMPGMDGFGFLDEFDKLDDSVRKKPRVIMLSTSESFKDLNRANQNKYVRKFLNKPLTAEIVKALNV